MLSFSSATDRCANETEGYCECAMLLVLKLVAGHLTGEDGLDLAAELGWAREKDIGRLRDTPELDLKAGALPVDGESEVRTFSGRKAYGLRLVDKAFDG